MHQAEQAVYIYLRRLETSRLVGPRDLDAALEAFEAEQGPLSNLADVDALANFLIDRGCLTRWQHRKLVAGRHQGFFLANFKLLEHLGSGGMSEVYLAEHIRMRRRVAIKILPVDRGKQGSCLERFRIEAQAAARLDHPNIVRIDDFGNVGELHYLVMEYVDGPDLAQHVQAVGPLPVVDAMELIAQAADGLQHAHSKGLVHRDIKPSNLLMDASGHLKLVDLGLARLDEAAAASVTMRFNDGILGTADYLAPEQVLDSHGVDHRCDLYSLGCTLYFLLTGRPPFPKGTVTQRMLAHLKREPAPVRELRPDVTESLEAIIRKLMAKRREDRFRSAREVAQALRNCAAHLSGQASSRGETAVTDTAILGGSQITQLVPLIEPDPSPELDARALQPARRRTSMRTGLGMGLGVALLSLVLTLILLSWLPGGDRGGVAPTGPVHFDPQAVLMVDCGRIVSEYPHQERGFAVELRQGERFDASHPRAPLQHGWRSAGGVAFDLVLPTPMSGELRLVTPASNPSYGVLLDGQQVVTVNQSVGGFRRVVVPVRPETSRGGRVQVRLTAEADQLVVIHRIEFVPR